MIAGQRSRWNPLMVDVLRDYGYIDAGGMGIRTKVIPLMKTHNRTFPVYEATDDYLRTVLSRGIGILSNTSPLQTESAAVATA